MTPMKKLPRRAVACRERKMMCSPALLSNIAKDLRHSVSDEDFTVAGPGIVNISIVIHGAKRFVPVFFNAALIRIHSSGLPQPQPGRLSSSTRGKGGGGGNVTGRGGQSSWHHGPKPTTMTRKKLCAAQPARAQLRPHVNRSHYVNTLVHHYMIRVICSATTYYTSTPTVEKLACSYLGSIASALPCKQQNKLDGVQGTLRRQIFLCMQI